MKKIFLLFLVFILLPLLSWSDFKVGIVFDKGGKDDKSFNSAAFVGLKKAESELKVKTKYVEGADDNAYEGMIRAFAQKDFDLIIAVGFSQGDAIKKVAKQFPQKHFAVIDTIVSDSPNVKSIIFEEHEGSFLVGVLAGLATKNKKIGFVGGMDIPLIRRFEKGFEAGLKPVNPKAQLLVNYVGVTGEAWNNPPKGKELALAQYTSGADIIFAVAGATNTGVFDAAEETKKQAIGVDSNQNWIKPGFILTSMLKRVDVAVFDVIKESLENKFQAGTQRFGLVNSGVDYSLDSYNQKLLKPEWLKILNETKQQIISQKINVPDYYKMKK